MATHKLGGLFPKALLVLSIVSIVPIFIIGYHVLSINTRMLNNERFMSKAPEAKVKEEKEKLTKYTQMMEQVQGQLKHLRG